MRNALLACCLLACGDDIPPPNTAPSAQSLAKPGARSTNGSCNPKNVNLSAGTAPAGWTLSGHIALRAQNGQLVSADATDATDKATGSHPINGQDKAALITAIRGAVCDANGLVAIPSPASPPDAELLERGALLDAYAPSAPDAKADLDLLCDGTTPPTDHPLSDLASAHDKFVWLTTPEWRLLEFDAEEALVRAGDGGGKKEMHAEAKRRAKIIGDAVTKAGKTRCWYVEILNAFGDSK